LDLQPILELPEHPETLEHLGLLGQHLENPEYLDLLSLLAFLEHQLANQQLLFDLELLVFLVHQVLLEVLLELPSDLVHLGILDHRLPLEGLLVLR
jgi:hypothetical protein